MFLIKNQFFKKIICLGLSSALIYNTTVPALGQEFFYTNPEIRIDNTYYDNLKSQVQAEIELARYNAKHKNKSYVRAEEIKYEVLGSPEDFVGEFFNDQKETQDKLPSNFEEFSEQYLKNVNDEYLKAKDEMQKLYNQELNKITKNNTIDILKNSTALQQKFNLDSWKEKNLANLDNFVNEEKNEVAIKKQYKEFQKQLDEITQQQIDDYFNDIKPLIKELIALYQQDPENIQQHLLEISNVIVGLSNSQHERLYNEEEREVLLNIYRQVIEENIKEENSQCKIKGYCSELLSSIFALGVLTDESEDAYLLYDVLITFYKTPASIPVVINTISALLTNKFYLQISNFLTRATLEDTYKDYKTTDLLSFGIIPEIITTAKGTYLGEVSKYGQYDDGNGYSQNMYYDIALMLAEEGSKESLSIIKNFGVDKCLFNKMQKINSNTGTNISVYCNAIKPFLAGALVSKKSGADKYSSDMPYYPEGTEKILPNGTVVKLTKEDINKTLLMKKNFSNYFIELANILKLDKQAALALIMINEARGDINEVAEYTLDKALYDTYKNSLQNYNFCKYAIIDEESKNAKASRYKAGEIGRGVAFLGDIAFTIYCLWDLGRLGLKMTNFSIALLRSFKAAKGIGSGINKIIKLPSFIKGYTINAIKQQKWYSTVQKVNNGFTKIRNNAKASITETTLFNRELFTSTKTPLQDIHVFTATNLEPQKTISLGKSLGQLSYDSGLGNFVFQSGKYGKKLTAEEVEIERILNTSASKAKHKYFSHKHLKKIDSYYVYYGRAIEKEIASSSVLVDSQKREFVNFVIQSRRNKIIKGKPIKGENSLLKTFIGTTVETATEVPVSISLMEKLHGVKNNSISSILFSPTEEGGYMLRLMDDLKNPINPSYFKMKLATEDLFAFAKASLELSGNSTKEASLGKIVLKFTPNENKWNTFLRNNVTNVFKKKENIFTGTGKVFIEDNGVFRETDIILSTYKDYNGASIYVSKNGARIAYPKKVGASIKKIDEPLNGSLWVPKFSTNDFFRISTQRDLNSPFHLMISGAQNKLNTLFLQSTISLGVASTGLVGPLKDNYPDISATDLILISSILPYAFSFLGPMVTPFVKRYGSAKVLLVSNALSFTALSMSMLAGFHGFGGIQPDNPFGNPSPKLLFPSAAMISLASMLKSASFNPLIQAVGSGGNTLKSKAFKSLSSFALVLPAAVTVSINDALPMYYKNSDGSIYIDKKTGQPVKRSVTDFAISYPFLAGLVGFTTFKILKSNFSSSIGAISNYKIGGLTGLVKESAKSYSSLFTNGMLPLTLGSFLLAGAEDIFLYSYSNSQSKFYLNQVLPKKEYASVAALLALNISPFIVRMKSSTILNKLGGDNVAGYQNLLKTFMGVSAIGIGTSMLQDNSMGFGAGLLLTSIGFSQFTNGILRGGALKLKSAGISKSVITSWNVSYPIVYFGYSAIPLLYSASADKSISNMNLQNTGDETFTRMAKNKSLHSNLWIGTLSFVAGSGLIAKGFNFGKKIKGAQNLRIPTGTFGISKGVLGSYTTPFSEINNQEHFPTFIFNDLNNININPKYKKNGILSLQPIDLQNKFVLTK